MRCAREPEYHIHVMENYVQHQCLQGACLGKTYPLAALMTYFPNMCFNDFFQFISVTPCSEDVFR
jgi:hypothetical protein